MTRKEWWKKFWCFVVIGALALGLIISLSLVLPRLVTVRGELTNAQAQLAAVTTERDGIKNELLTVTANLTQKTIELIAAKAEIEKLEGEKSALEEALSEALGENLPTKAQIENFLHANFNTCRTTTVDGLREAFPELKIEGLPLTPQGEEGSCYVQVRVAGDRGFFIIGQTLIPLIVW